MEKGKILPLFTVALLLLGVLASSSIGMAQTANSIKLLEFSSSGGLFMSPWNPVDGFQDIYSQNLWQHVREWGLYSAPDTGMPVETTATYQYIGNYTVEGTTAVPHIVIPASALVFDPFMLKWVPMSVAAANQTYASYINEQGLDNLLGFFLSVGNYLQGNGKAQVEIIFNFDQVPWHTRINFSVADVLAWLAFMWRWTTDTSVLTNQTDQYYDADFAGAVGSMVGMIEGVQIINDTAIAIYTNYVDVDPSLIAYTIIPYPPVPYELLASMELAVINSTNLWWEDTTTPEGGTLTGIDMLVNAPEIKAAAQALTPSKLYYFNGLSTYGYNYGNDLSTRTSALINWINTHGVAAVSNGPFYVDSYNAQSNTLVLKSRTFLGLPKIKYHYKNLVVPGLDEILVESVTTEDAGIQAVKSGTADIFFYAEPINKIGTVPSTVTLIPATTTYNDLGVNPVSNIYDPTKPGKIQLKDRTLNGTVIPGLVLYNPRTVLDTDLSIYGHPDWVPFNLLNLTVMKDPHFQFNPMGIDGVRFALNLLINRNSLVQNIYQGSAAPMLSAIVPFAPAYKLLNISKVEQKVGIYPSGDINAAVALYNQSIAAVNETLNAYGLSLNYIPDSSGTPWLTLILPDGTQKTVTIYFEIRVDDPFRLAIGEQVTTWIQQYFHIKVQEDKIQRTVTKKIFYTDMATFAFGDHPWSLYTEGWQTTVDEPAVWARYGVAQMYAPFASYGLNPTPNKPDQWYLFNETIYQLGQKLAFGIYTPQQISDLYNDIITLDAMGMQQSLRIFLNVALSYYMVNGAKVVVPLYGSQAGLGSMWGLNTAYVVGATTTTTTTTAAGGMSTGAIVGIVVVIIIIIAGLAWWLMRRK